MSDLFRPQVIDQQRQRLLGEVILTDARSSKLFVIAASSLFIGAVLFVLLGSYSRNEQVVGVVTTDVPPVKVYASRIGVIERLFVTEGQHVQAGQALAYIQVDRLDNELRGVATQRIDALKAQSSLLRQNIENARSSYDSEIRRVQTEERSTRIQLSSLTRQTKLQRKIVSHASEVILRLTPLADSGYLSRFELERRKQEALIAEQQLEQLLQQQAQLNSVLGQITSSLERLPIELDRQLTDLETQLQRVTQEQAAASVDVGYTVVAPAAGVVTSLQASGGKSVDVVRPLLTLLQKTAAFELVVFVPSRAAAFIQPGQTVHVMYDALPYRKFGSYDGQIITISKYAMSPTEIDAPITLNEPVYVARIGPGQRKPPEEALQVGMTLKASIILEKRSVLGWMLEPINTLRSRM